MIHYSIHYEGSLYHIHTREGVGGKMVGLILSESHTDKMLYIF